MRKIEAWQVTDEDGHDFLENLYNITDGRFHDIDGVSNSEAASLLVIAARMFGLEAVYVGR